MSKIIETLVPILTPLLLALVAYLVARLKAATPATREQQAVDTIQTYAGLVVADKAPAVEALKDPGKPGVWTPAIAAATKDAAVGRVIGLTPGPLTTLADVGHTHEEIIGVVGAAVEQAVAGLKSGAMVVPTPSTTPTAPKDGAK